MNRSPHWFYPIPRPNCNRIPYYDGFNLAKGYHPPPSVTRQPSGFHLSIQKQQRLCLNPTEPSYKVERRCLSRRWTNGLYAVWYGLSGPTFRNTNVLQQSSSQANAVATLGRMALNTVKYREKNKSLFCMNVLIFCL